MESDELRKLKMDIMEAERTLDSARLEYNGLLEKIESAKNKLKDIEPLKERAVGEYKEKIYEVIETDKKLESMDSDMDVIKKGEKSILVRLEAEIKEKTKKLNAFKQTKKDFIKSLDDREKDLNAKDYDYFTRLQIFNEKERELTERENKLKNGLESLTKNIGAIKHQEIQIKAVQGQIDAKKRNTELSLTNALKLKARIEQELAQHKEMTKLLVDRGKIVDSREEILNKRDGILNNKRQLIKSEKSALDKELAGLDKQKEDRIIALRGLTNSIKQALADFKQGTSDLESLKRDISTAENHKNHTESELKQRIELKRTLDGEISGNQAKIEQLSQQKTRIFEEIEAETGKKSQEFERFAQGKKDLLARITDKENELTRKELRLSERLSETNREITEERELMAIESALLENNHRKLNKQQRELNDKKQAIEGKERQVEVLLSQASTLKARMDAETKEQEAIGKELADREAIVSAQIETMEKQKQFLNKCESQLNKDQAKLADDRRTLNRAWASRH